MAHVYTLHPHAPMRCFPQKTLKVHAPHGSPSAPLPWAPFPWSPPRTNISAGLKVSEGTPGLMVTMPGVLAALAGPALIVASGPEIRRHFSDAQIAQLTFAVGATRSWNMLNARFHTPRAGGAVYR